MTSVEPVCRALTGHRVIVLDTETSSLHPWRDGKILAGVGVKVLDGPSFYIPFRHADTDNVSLAELPVLAHALRGHTLAGHHLMFDLAVLWQEGIDLVDEDVLDTVTVTRLVSEDEPSYKLKLLAKKYVDGTAGETEKALKQYMRLHKLTTYDQVPASEILAYVPEMERESERYQKSSRCKKPLLLAVLLGQATFFGRVILKFDRLLCGLFLRVLQ